MDRYFNDKGELIFPPIQKGFIKKQGKDGQDTVINEAFCPNGHSLISEELIEGEKGIHFIYADEAGNKETDIIVSPVVRKRIKRVLKGEPFAEGDIVKILCPVCRTELPVLFNCECGAPIYLFYLDNSLKHECGQSFCSRIGCVKSSHLRLSKDALADFINSYSF